VIAAFALAMLLRSPDVEATFVLRGEPSSVIEIARLTRATAEGPWRIADVRRAQMHDGRASLTAPPGTQTLIVIRLPPHVGYLTHGPFVWPAAPAHYDVDKTWRRTVRGRSPGGGTLKWVTAASDAGHVFCDWVAPGQWQCLGIPYSVCGVVIRAHPSAVLYSIVRSGGPRNEIENVSTASASWGRLLVVEEHRGSGEEPPANLRVQALRLYRPRARPNTTRFEVSPDARVQTEQLDRNTIWVTSSDGGPDGWLEVTSAGTGVARVPVAEISAGPPSEIVSVELERPMAVFGRITRSLARPAPDTVVSLYRFGELISSQEGKKPERQRIAVAEGRTDADGVFQFVDLVPETYELVALHQSYGRSVRRIEPYETAVEIVLTAPAIVRGRVIRGGAPQSGVPVTYVPDLAAFAVSSDATALRGGETHTDSDGRFRLAAAISGAGELRIGSSETGIKRVAIGPADALPAVTDLGDIELDDGVTVTIVFEEAGNCLPLVTGPAGRAGLTVVRAIRDGPAMFHASVPEPGTWNIVALCGTRERGIFPPAIHIKPGTRDQVVQIRWR
jgi:hypothetical protein